VWAQGLVHSQVEHNQVENSQVEPELPINDNGQVRSSNPSSDLAALILDVYESALGRPPSAEQVGALQGYIQQLAQTYSTHEYDPRVWADVCHAIMNMKEFIYLN
jgi:hypothetical protein